jgi:transposase-like protein
MSHSRKAVELPRFRGHPIIGAERSVHDAEEPSAVPAGVPATHCRTGAQRGTPEELSRQFEPSAQAIRTWVRQADRDEGRRQDGLTTAEQEEVRRLRRENRTLREEREIPRKVGQEWSTTPSERSDVGRTRHPGRRGRPVPLRGRPGRLRRGGGGGSRPIIGPGRRARLAGLGCRVWLSTNSSTSPTVTIRAASSSEMVIPKAVSSSASNRRARTESMERSATSSRCGRIRATGTPLTRSSVTSTSCRRALVLPVRFPVTREPGRRW